MIIIAYKIGGSSQEEELIYSDNTHAKEVSRRRHERPYNNQPKETKTKPTHWQE